MIKRYLAIFTLVLSLAGLTIFANGAGQVNQAFAAGVNDFVITSFKSDQTLTRNDPQGELHIVEKIRVDFSAYNHGIYRTVPVEYKGNNMNFHLNSVTSDTSAPTNVEQKRSNGNVVLRIGDKNKTVTGIQEYTIDYTLQNVITFYDGHDELYWDVNGDQWDQSVRLVELRLTFPDDLKLSSNKPKCFVGGYGNTGDECDISVSGNLLQASASNLQPEQTLTYVAGFEEGYFTPMSGWEKYSKTILLLLFAIGPTLVGFVAGFWLWFKRGRDAKGRGVVVPQYSPPSDISPIEAGTIVDFKVDSRDITAVIISLAIKKYIKISESKGKGLLGKKLEYQLELLNEDKSSLDSYERDLLGALFKAYNVGSLYDVGAPASSSTAIAIKAIRDNVTKSLTSRGYFKPNQLFKAAWPIAFLLILPAGWAMHLLNSLLNGREIVFLVSTVIGAGIFGLFMVFMPARTAKGADAKEQIQGLKMYMDVADKDRIEKLDGPNAKYVQKGDEPVRNVEFFEKLLPYAVALGVEKQWAKQFADIYKTPPDWYSGNDINNFSTGYLIGGLSNSLVSSVGSSFSTSSSSSGSGFSGGGGFAGGGGGGGGGGGW